MIIQSLSVTDFRVFQGRNTFDLAPRTKWNATRPIVLFGGLNGAGKTSVLTAIRLALYGKQALGRSISAKHYEDYLRSCVHKSRERLLQANAASLELQFRYTHMGVDNQFVVKRSWYSEGKKLVESLDIFRDGEHLDRLTSEQKQGFLNELIPIGLSDLFFFDGEKIAELALDESGAVLADSIKKLLGLDMIERLESDLSVIVREHERTLADSRGTREIDTLRAEFERLMENADKAEKAFRDIRPAWEEAKVQLASRENDFLSRGGAFASSRAAEEQKHRDLCRQRDELHEEMRSLLGGTVPFALAPTVVTAMLQQVEKEQSVQQAWGNAKAADQFKERLLAVLKAELEPKAFVPVQGVVERVRKEYSSSDQTIAEIHGLGGRLQGRIEATIEKATADKQRLATLADELSRVNEEIDKVGLQIARAPDEVTLKTELESLTAMRERISAISVKREGYRETARSSLREAKEIARVLDQEQEAINAAAAVTKDILLAKMVQRVLSAFGKRASTEKTTLLAREFSESFERLARKDDMSVSADINPETFHVALRNREGRLIDEDELSAGEKQIYAIAMLEALAKTSGRKLPIIIDTPLGRLDSKHREKLVNNYFPTASHQVVILSTDTEVDEQFYRDLNKHISHSYKLEYDPSTGHTTASESYFWKNATKVEAA